MSEVITIDGLDLTTYAQKVTIGSSLWNVPAPRGGNPRPPGRHGSIHTPGKTFEPAVLALRILVRGANPDGTVPADRVAQVRANRDELLRILTVRHRLMRIEWTLSDGTVRQCDAECLAPIDIERLTGDLARMPVELEVPAAFWADPTPVEYASPAGLVPPADLAVPGLYGATAPMTRPVVLVHGPIETPQLHFPAAGSYLTLGRIVADGDTWRVDAAVWSSTVGAALTFDTAGTDASGDTTRGGTVPMVQIYPPRASSEVVATLNGSAAGVNTQVELRARRRYLVN